MSAIINIKDYLNELKKRQKRSRVYKKFQLDGLVIAELLSDPKHKSLYIKLAKEIGGEKLMPIAKEIAENKKIKNRGAYFMWELQRKKIIKKTKGGTNKILKNNKKNANKNI